jgi:uncharacterized protein YllA (UPF0747 family)
MRTELGFELLPGIPEIWLDFLNARLPLAPANRNMDFLAAHADAYRRQAANSEILLRIFAAAAEAGAPVRDALDRLRQPGTVAVLAGICPGLFGGPAFQTLKCLTALKICEELARRKISAVPVCWIRSFVPATFPGRSIALLDAQSEIQSLTIHTSGAEDFTPWDRLPEREAAALVSRMREIGRDSFDPETLEIIETAYGAGNTYAQATAKLLSAFLEDRGLIVCNSCSPDFRRDLGDGMSLSGEDSASDYVLQSLCFPAAVCVIDYGEIQEYMDAQQKFRALNLLPPLAWPQTSATVGDARSRKILERYGLDLTQLYFGAQSIMDSLEKSMPTGIAQQLYGLQQEAENRIDKVRALYSSGRGFEKEVANIRERIIFQLNRLREKSDAACKNRSGTTARRMRRVCNALTPNGRIQERDLAGIQWPLRYSRNVFRSLYDRLDIMSSLHQLIFMD